MPAIVDEPKQDDDWMNSWSTGTKKKDKKSKGKGFTEITTEPSTDASMMQPESIQEKSAEENDPWSMFGTVGKKSKASKAGKKGGVMEMPPAPTPPDQGLDDPQPDNALLDFDDGGAADDSWGGFGTAAKKSSKADSKLKKGSTAKDDLKLGKTKSKDSKDSKSKEEEIPPVVEEPVVEEPKPASPKEEKKSKSSGWGSSLWGSSKKDTKSSKDKEKEKEKKEKEAAEAAEAAEAQKKADEEAFAAALGDDPNDEILEVVDEAPAKKSSSKDKDSKKKSSKSDSKSKKAEPAPPVVADPAPLDDLLNEEATSPKAEPKKAEGWGFWGASLKSSKKAPDTKKEIGMDAPANDGPPLTEQPKMPEFTFDDDAGAAAAPPPKSSSKSKKSSGSVQDRIKALQGEKDAKKASFAPEPEPIPEDLPPPPPPVEEKKSKKSSSATKSSSKKAAKELEPVADTSAVDPPKSTSPLPGGFPTDDLLDSPPPMSPPKKSSSKDKKSKSSKKDAMPAVADPPAGDDLLMDDAPKLPTPPPEKEKTKKSSSKKEESKPSKKERPKVVRDEGSSSWGFWGASAPPPKTKSKEGSKDSDQSPTKTRPSMSRSKSERKPKDKDPLDKASKSSGSDKDGKSKSRPSTSRGMSFSGMFGMGAPPPSRSKSTREKHGSRRQSMAVDDSGMISPPPEDVKPREMSAKAAKVMGVGGRSKSTREKTKSRKVPDPYAIDDDDMVIVDNPEDSAKDMPQFDIPKKEKRPSKPKRRSTYMSGGLGDADDEVMVDAPPPGEEMQERPGLVRRSTTSNAKKGGLMGGILGAFSTRPGPPDRRQSKMYESENEPSRRKRGSAYDEEGSKRLRREDRKVGRSRKISDADGFTDAAPQTDAEAAAAKEARRAERKARKEREAADDEARAARRREKDDARRAEDDARRHEDRQARRAEREARRAEEDRMAREDDAKAAERRERRKERERQREAEDPSSRPKAERRRSHMDDDAARRARHEERRMRRSVDPESGLDGKGRPRTSRRRSEHPAPVDGYFDSRNGEPHHSRTSRGPRADEPRKPSGNGKDKISSWVDAVSDDPPPPPPVEGTIVDAPMHFAEDHAPDGHPLEDEEPTTAREMREGRARRGKKDMGGDEDSERRRRRRERRHDEEMVKSSEGSSHGRRKAGGGPSNSLGYDDMGGFDERPAMPPKRQSWFNKITGF